jgi:signal transduction histidine kinase
MRSRRGVLGLRGRIVGALLVTTVATLGVAALALLGPLEHQLRQAELNTLIKSVKNEEKGFTKLQPGDLTTVRGKPASSAAHGAAVLLAGRTGSSSVSLLGFPRVLLATNNVEQAYADDFRDVTTAFRTNRRVESFGSSDEADVARVAIPIQIGCRAPSCTYVLAVRKPILEVAGAVHVVRDAFITAALAGVVLTLILGIPLAATLVRRLRRLHQAALRLAQGGPPVEVPEDRARDEVGDLTRTFGTMQRRLKHQEEARRAFVATASHELRTPLASLHGMLELLEEDLREDEPDIEDARVLLERARAQAHRLNRLAADLLDLSRLDAEVELRTEPVELGELSRAVLAEFELGSAERGITSRLDDERGPVWALGDPGSVAQILRILIDNALRASPEGAEIKVTVDIGDGPVTVSVTDGGPGVAPEERELIFERFQRGRATGGEAGFGLGLAIGRELAERMGGELTLEDGARPGATFTIRLPAARAPDQDAVAVA